MTWRERIRELLVAGVLVVSVGTGAALSGAPSSNATAIKVAAFNIQVFGKTKFAKDDIVDVLARVVQQFDVVLVQEVRDADEEVADRFLDRINRDAEAPYAMVEGPRLGRTSSKEQYVVYYRTSAVTFLNSFTVPDPDDRFEREPLVASFRAGFFDFRLVGCHVKPADVDQELSALAEVADAVTDSTEGDVIVLGDFNADCSYFNETGATNPLRASGFHWVISNEEHTAVASGCTYDRIVLRNGTFGREYVSNSATVYRYDQEFGITDTDFVKSVSDHFPVYAEFTIAGPDDDGEVPIAALGLADRKYAAASEAKSSQF